MKRAIAVRATTAKPNPGDTPAMTPTQQDLIRSTWGQVAPIADQAAILFYERLFELDPTLRRLFSRTDMPAQRKNLMQTLTVVVKSIDRLDTIIPAVEALG